MSELQFPTHLAHILLKTGFQHGLNLVRGKLDLPPFSPSHNISQESIDRFYHVLDFFPHIILRESAVIGVGSCCGDTLQEVI